MSVQRAVASTLIAIQAGGVVLNKSLIPEYSIHAIAGLKPLS